MKSKRILSAVCALAMVFASVPLAEVGGFTKLGIEANAFENDGDFTYTLLDDGTYELSHYSGNDADVTVPETFNGKNVTSIGWSAFGNNIDLKSVTISENIKSIGHRAFQSCTNLKTVTFKGHLTIIDSYAFVDCTGLTSITPIDADIIGVNAFLSCTSLKSVTILDSVMTINSRAFGFALDNEYNFYPLNDLTVYGYKDSEAEIYANENNINFVDLGEEHTYGDWTYSFLDDGTVMITSYNGTETNIAIPSALDGYTVTRIRDSAFYYCTDLESVTIPDSVTTIGAHAFHFCVKLKNVTIPDSVTLIGSYAFSRCDSFTNITIPDSVTTLGNSAFENCPGLTSVTIGNGVTSINSSTFNLCPALKDVTIGNSVKSIADYAFSGCKKLEGIIMPEGVTSIGENAFSGCEKLKSAAIPDSVTWIGGWAFSGCESLSGVTIPDGVTYVGKYAFMDCKSLPANITIPKNVKNIGNLAFGFVYDDDYNKVKIEGFTITGYKGSAAERYAAEYDFTFVEIAAEPGDADKNGKVDVSDVLLVQQYLANWDVVIDLDAADYDGDGEVNVGDVLLAQQKIAGWYA